MLPMQGLAGSIPDQGTKTPQAAGGVAKKKSGNDSQQHQEPVFM